MSNIVRVDHADAATGIAARLEPSARLVRLEGFMGVGKTLFGRQLAETLGFAFIDSDEFASPSEAERAYIDCLRLKELRSTIIERLRAQRVVFAAVCSQEILPPCNDIIEFRVYLKRLSFSTPEWPFWHKDPDFGVPPSQLLERSVYEYHLAVEPHKNAHLTLEIPEKGHCLNASCE